MARIARLALTSVVLMVVAGCGSTGPPKVPGGVRTDLFDEMTAAEFHRIGVAADALPLGSGETAAIRLDASQADVNTFEADLCAGRRPFLNITAFHFTAQIPAFEEIFDDVESRCPKSENLVASVRGTIARSIADNEEFLNRITGRSGADRFCDELGKVEGITKTVIIKAMVKTKMVEGTSKDIAALGVTLLLKSCPALVDQLGG